MVCATGNPPDSNAFPIAFKVSHVRRPTTTFIFSEENLQIIPGISGARLNDTNLLIGEGGGNDTFATFHMMKNGDWRTGDGNAVFVDGSVTDVPSEATAKERYDLARPK